MKKKDVPKPPVRVIEYFFIRHTRHTLLPPLVSVVVSEAPIFDFTTQPTVAQVGSPPGSRGPAHAKSTPSHCTHSSLPHCNHIPHCTSHPFCLHFSPLQPTCTQPCPTRGRVLTPLHPFAPDLLATSAVAADRMDHLISMPR